MTSLREHKAATRRGELEKSDHCGGCWSHLHQEDWDTIKVSDEVANNTTLYSSKKPSTSVSQAQIH